MRHFLIISSLVVLACSGDHHSLPAEQAIAVRLAPVEHEQFSIPVQGSGYLYANQEVKLAFKTGGIISRIDVESGSAVRKGQLLAQLNLSEIAARVDQASSAVAKADRDLERVKRLFTDSVATMEQMQNAQTGLEIADANLQIAQFNLKHSQIIAPDDGTILYKLFEPGELVGPAMPVLVFANSTKAWKLKAGLSARDILQLQIGDSAMVRVDAYNQQKFKARVSQIGQAPNPRSGLFEVVLKFNGNVAKLLSGMFATVQIFPANTQSYTLIPVEALNQAHGRQGIVYRIQDSLAQEINVEIVRIIDEQVIISSGLEKVASVITSGSAYLRQGTKVKVLED